MWTPIHLIACIPTPHRRYVEATRDSMPNWVIVRSKVSGSCASPRCRCRYDYDRNIRAQPIIMHVKAQQTHEDQLLRWEPKANSFKSPAHLNLSIFCSRLKGRRSPDVERSPSLSMACHASRSASSKSCRRSQSSRYLNRRTSACFNTLRRTCAADVSDIICVMPPPLPCHVLLFLSNGTGNAYVPMRLLYFLGHSCDSLCDKDDERAVELTALTAG